MGNYENEKLNNNTNTTSNNNNNSNNKNCSYKKENSNLNSSFNGLCGNISNQEVIYNKKNRD